MAWQGGCACGAVRYETEGPVFNQTLCHCVDCRRASGAPALAWFSVPTDALRWSAGAPVVHRSSARARRSHCGSCGTQLTWQGDAYPDEIDVATATLDDPELAPPRDHTFASERLSWLKLDDGLPAYPRTRSEGL
jgi:hypothetical protein